jgi:hypothetical protein
VNLIVTVVVSAFTRGSAGVPSGRFRRDVPVGEHAIVER